MNLAFLNTLSADQLRDALFQCCGAKRFVDIIVPLAPFSSEGAFKQAVEVAFSKMSREDWLEAFKHHPMIGDLESIKKKFASTAHLASGEQAAVAHADEAVFSGLAHYNKIYLEKFGFIFIICATGKSAPYMLEQLQQRFQNPPDQEWRLAAEEQKKITWIRLEKLG